MNISNEIQNKPDSQNKSIQSGFLHIFLVSTALIGSATQAGTSMAPAPWNMEGQPTISHGVQS